MDALIEMVSKLKNEKEVYKVQVKHLVQLINSPKVKAINGKTNHPTTSTAALASALAALERRRNAPPKELSVPGVMDDGSARPGPGECAPGNGAVRNGLGLPMSEQPTPTTPGCCGAVGGVGRNALGFQITDQLTPTTPGDADLDLARTMYKLLSGNRCSRSSTVTTFVPSSPEDVASVSDLRDMLDEKQKQGFAGNLALSPTTAGDSSGGPLVSPAPNGVRIPSSTMTSLRDSIQKLQAMDQIDPRSHSLSPTTPNDDYPKFVQCIPDLSNAATSGQRHGNNNRPLGDDIVPSVYNGSGPQKELEGSELIDLGQANGEQDEEGNSASVRPKTKSKKSREKLNFIVYI